MTRRKGSNHPVARRVAMATMTVLAASGAGMVAAPMAFGQLIVINPNNSQGATVTNSGSASANTGGNSAVGNSSSNTVTLGAAGGLVNVPLDLGGTVNTSEGEATVTSGAASATGNSSDTGVGQSNASGNQVGGFLAGQQQAAGVTNAGSASANSGGNTAVGNNSTNSATVQDVSGGLVGVGISLGGSVNNSTGEATIVTGTADAVGNSSSSNVGQASVQGGGGGAGPGGFGGPGALVRPGGPAGPCGTARFGSFQNVNVVNQGQAQATTGNNTAIGNNSTNTADLAGGGQTVSGGLLGVGISLGGPVNNSSGTAVITTGPATAVGNDSITEVGQVQGCPQVATLSGPGRPGVIVPAGHVPPRVGTLARTGLDTADLGMIAGALLGAGMLLVASQRRRMAAARSASAPMAGFGLGMGGDDWDRAVR